MAINASDVKLVLSGGSYNSDPNKSLGGEPSLRVVWGTNNNLFDDVTAYNAQEGFIDYRCIYAVNNSATETFYDTKIFIDSQIEDGAIIQTGVAKETDVQHIIVSGIAEGGSFKIEYEGNEVTVQWDAILANWGKNLQDGLNALTDLSGVVVNVSSYRNDDSTRDLTRLFEVRFEGQNNYRYHSLIVLTSNNITPPSPTIQILKHTNGCPINSIAPEIEVKTSEPYGVEWESPNYESPLSIGDLHAGEVFPIWFKRTIPEDTDPLEYDNFVLKLIGKPFI